MKAHEIAKQPLVPGLPNLIVVALEGSANEALAMMSNFKIHHLIVLARDGFRGIVSDRDIIAHALRHGLFERLAEIQIKEIMRRDTPVVSESADLGDVLALMDEYRSSALAIRRDGRVVGIITDTDIRRARRQLLAKDETTQNTAGV
jgi:CBS domain-containing protein